MQFYEMRIYCDFLVSSNNGTETGGANIWMLGIESSPHFWEYISTHFSSYIGIRPRPRITWISSQGRQQARKSSLGRTVIASAKISPRVRQSCMLPLSQPPFHIGFGAPRPWFIAPSRLEKFGFAVLINKFPAIKCTGTWWHHKAIKFHPIHSLALVKLFDRLITYRQSITTID